MDEAPTRMLVFGGQVTEGEAAAIRTVYRYVAQLSDPVRRVVVRDLAATYGAGRIIGPCPCPCHAAVAPGLVPCPACEGDG